MKDGSVWRLLNQILSGNLHAIKWKNPPAKPNEKRGYEPTEVEHCFNCLTHGFLILPSIYASGFLYYKSPTYEHKVVSIIYGSSLVFLFSFSFIYHFVCYTNKNVFLKDLLHRLDRAMIYVFIASSYYPWLVLENFKYPSIAAILRWLIWMLAALGVLYQQIFHEQYKFLDTIFYIIIGLTPAIVLILLCGHELLAMFELEIGGAIYLIGVFFFKLDGKLCLAHGLWHIFVGLAATTHYFAILNHLYLNQYNPDKLTNT